MNIDNQIEEIIKYCKSRDCEKCKFHQENGICKIHNPSMWEV